MTIHTYQVAHLLRRIACSFALFCFVADQHSRADIELMFEPGVFEINSGIQSLNLLARSTSANELFSFTADSKVSAGIFAPTPVVFGDAGQIGDGNIDGASLTERDGLDFTKSYLSLEFTNEQLFPNIFSPIATLKIDITESLWVPILFNSSTRQPSVSTVMSMSHGSTEVSPF